MVIVRLNGGIGNQMFQYAAARRIAHVNKVPLKLDLSWFGEVGPWTKRYYELDAFKLSADIATIDEIHRLKSRTNKTHYKYLPFFIKDRFFNTKKSHIREKYYNFDPGILKLKSNIYLDGYWQSEKYFKDIEIVLRNDFSFRTDADNKNKEYIRLIESTESVSVHIRRGDYVSSSKTKAFHGVCSLSYYEEAICRIREQINEPVFFVFSDEIEWVKANLSINAETYYVDFNGPDRGRDDLRLMSICKHHIIANSSFSWWGAWLCSHLNKLIYAPKKWFENKIDTSDNIPESWIKI